MYYPAALTPYEDSSGRYGVTFVDLPGCVSVGENLDDALRMAAEALSLHAGSMLEDNDPLPPPSSLAQTAKEHARFCEEESIPHMDGTLYHNPARWYARICVHDTNVCETVCSYAFVGENFQTALTIFRPNKGTVFSG